MDSLYEATGMKTRAAILLAYFFISELGYALNAEQCRVLMPKLVDHMMVEGVYGEPFEVPGVGQLSPAPLKLHPGKKIELIRSQFIKFANTEWYDSDAIYIGISSHHREGDFHFYMISDNLRLDGPGGLGPSKVHDSPPGKVPLATDGVLFKLKVGKEKREAITAAIKKEQGEISLNCAIPIVKILKANGIEIDVTDKEGKGSANALATNLTFGQVKVGDKKVPTAVLATSQDAFNYFLITAEKIDESLERKGDKKAP